MKRGAIVTAAFSGDFGKPRPAVVIQAELFNESHSSITVAPISGTIIEAPMFRITVDPSPGNGLKKVSQIMVDRVTSLRRERIGRVIGQADDDSMLRVTRALAVWLGVA